MSKFINTEQHEKLNAGDSLLHPVSQVYFRAGLIACREYMARFVEAESPSIAMSIRANWWPSLGQDFGPPRQLDFAEVTSGEYGTPDFRIKTADEVSPTQEALPIALGFLQLAALPVPEDSHTQRVIAEVDAAIEQEFSVPEDDRLTKDHSAGLIHHVASPLAETEPRLDIRAQIVAAAQDGVKLGRLRPARRAGLRGARAALSYATARLQVLRDRKQKQVEASPDAEYLDGNRDGMWLAWQVLSNLLRDISEVGSVSDSEGEASGPNAQERSVNLLPKSVPEDNPPRLQRIYKCSLCGHLRTQAGLLRGDCKQDGCAVVVPEDDPQTEER